MVAFYAMEDPRDSMDRAEMDRVMPVVPWSSGDRPRIGVYGIIPDDENAPRRRSALIARGDYLRSLGWVAAEASAETERAFWKLKKRNERVKHSGFDGWELVDVDDDRYPPRILKRGDSKSDRESANRFGEIRSFGRMEDVT